MVILKFVADVNVEKALVDYLRAAGHDVIWVPEYDCKMQDDELLRLARRQKRILVTNDKDFGELVYLQKRHAGGIILLRIQGQRTEDKLRLMERLLMRFSDRLIGHYVVVTSKRIRISAMEQGK